MWERLRGALTRFVARLVHHAQEAEDIVSDVVWGAWRRFGAIALWQDVWCWSVAVARRLVARLFRSTHKKGMTPLDGAPQLVASSSATRAAEAEDFVAVVALRLRTADQETLRCLVSGVTANSEIASARRVSIRAVQNSRHRLKQVAEGVERLALIGGASSGRDRATCA